MLFAFCIFTALNNLTTTDCTSTHDGSTASSTGSTASAVVSGNFNEIAAASLPLALSATTIPAAIGMNYIKMSNCTSTNIALCLCSGISLSYFSFYIA